MRVFPTILITLSFAPLAWAQVRPAQTSNGATRVQVRYVQAEPISPERLPPPAGQPLANDLSLLELRDLALANNPALAQAAARVEAARGEWVQVGLRPNPVIGYAASDVGAGDTAGQQGGFISKKFITKGKLGLNRAVAGSQIEFMEQQWSAQRLRVLNDVRMGYFDVLFAQRQTQVARDLIKASEQVVELVRALVNAEEASQAELLQAEVQSESARFVLQRARSENEAAWRRLLPVLGVPDLECRPVSGDLEQNPPEFTWDGTLRHVLENSPEVSAAMAEIDRASWAVQRAQVESVPNVDVEFGVFHDNTIGDAVSQIRVGLPIPILNGNQGNIRKTYAELDSGKRNLLRVEADLERRLAAVFQRYSNGHFRVKKYQQDILPKVNRSLELTTAAYRAQELGFVDLLNAQRTLFRTKLDYVAALRELWSSVVEIEGLLLTGSLK